MCVLFRLVEGGRNNFLIIEEPKVKAEGVVRSARVFYHFGDLNTLSRLMATK